MSSIPPPGGQQPPPPPGGAMPPGPGGMPYQSYAESSQATLALILGIVGLVVCAIAAPFAWSIGNKELQGIDAGRRDPSNRGQANAGKILGIIGTVLMVLAFVAIILLFIVGAASSA